jgi:prepilin-type N-terminal cleavage/methylation domain-containing protein
MRSQSGFTLIEVIAASAISSFVGIALLSVLYMANGQIKEGSATVKLTHLQIVASEQIHQSARKAAGVRLQSESPSVIAGAAGYPGANSVKHVLFCDPAGAILSGYFLNAGTLLEWDLATSGWVPFRIAGTLVEVDDATSFFDLLPNRHGITARIAYRLSAGATPYAFPTLAETVRCRNTSI